MKLYKLTISMIYPADSANQAATLGRGYVDSCPQLADDWELRDYTVEPYGASDDLGESLDYNQKETVSCWFCKKALSRAQAIEEGWIPSFYSMTDIEILQPVCPVCVRAHLHFTVDSEWEEDRP